MGDTNITESQIPFVVKLISRDDPNDFRYATLDLSNTWNLEEAFQTLDREAIEAFRLKCQRSRLSQRYTVEIAQMPVQDAQTRTEPILCKDGFIRTAIVLTPEKDGGSIEVLSADGKRLCILNLHDFKNGRGNIDVIVDDDRSLNLAAWEEGRPVLNQPVPTGLVSVQINNSLRQQA